ncbi:hypothetical protein P4O66_011571 [Electrophorus voltai]|uniref:Uncharacterized protein n=1 Tax=Electrophorus voltai TaxID=2609070 RepID=A0AAD8Z5C9_9TELE|nr:hypothetical protein P4O66_011571 [Electrophorus voltai]
MGSLRSILVQVHDEHEATQHCALAWRDAERVPLLCPEVEARVSDAPCPTVRCPVVFGSSSRDLLGHVRQLDSLGRLVSALQSTINNISSRFKAARLVMEGAVVLEERGGQRGFRPEHWPPSLTFNTPTPDKKQTDSRRARQADRRQVRGPGLTSAHARNGPFPRASNAGNLGKRHATPPPTPRSESPLHRTAHCQHAMPERPTQLGGGPTGIRETPHSSWFPNSHA